MFCTYEKSQEELDDPEEAIRREIGSSDGYIYWNAFIETAVRSM